MKEIKRYLEEELYMMESIINIREVEHYFYFDCQMIDEHKFNFDYGIWTVASIDLSNHHSLTLKIDSDLLRSYVETRKKELWKVF